MWITYIFLLATEFYIIFSLEDLPLRIVLIILVNIINSLFQSNNEMHIELNKTLLKYKKAIEALNKFSKESEKIINSLEKDRVSANKKIDSLETKHSKLEKVVLEPNNLESYKQNMNLERIKKGLQMMRTEERIKQSIKKEELKENFKKRKIN